MYSRRARFLPRGPSRSSSTGRFETTFTVVKVFIIAVVAVVLLVGVFTTMSDDHQARAMSALQDEGYTNITLERAYWMTGCGKEDTISYLARATNVRGKRVELIVCMGYWKGVTIRHK